MKTFSKLILIIIIVSIARFIPSCCSCQNDEYSFSYETIAIRNIDNSGAWSKPSTKNVMPAKGVAFEIQIKGIAPVMAKCNNLQSLGFNTLTAQTCNCDELYYSTSSIQDIRIRTLEKINDDFCCGDDVTNLFLANSCISCEDIGNFYITIDELVRRINPEALNKTLLNSFLIYLSVPVENSVAQFEIEVELSDGTSIVAQTSLITII